MYKFDHEIVLSSCDPSLVMSISISLEPGWMGLVKCPYDRRHEVKPTRLINHLLKCAPPPGYMVCQWDVFHIYRIDKDHRCEMDLEIHKAKSLPPTSLSLPSPPQQQQQQQQQQRRTGIGRGRARTVMPPLPPSSQPPPPPSSPPPPQQQQQQQQRRIGMGRGRGRMVVPSAPPSSRPGIC
jgi:hypothetical protein